MPRSLLRFRIILILLTVAAFITIAAGFKFYQPDLSLDYLKSKYAGPGSKFMKLRGMDVHYRDQGQGQPLVLIHGTASSLHTWDGWVKRLSPTRRVVRLDLPAFGLTGPNPGHDYSIRYYCDFLAAFLGKLSIDACDLAGNSLGGRIAWGFAWRYPNRVRRLVLIDPAGFSLGKEKPFVLRIAGMPVLGDILKYAAVRGLVEKSVQEVYGDEHKITPRLIDRYYELTLRPGNREAFGVRAAMAYTDETGKLKQIKSPALIMWGEKDAWIPVAHAKLFAQALPQAKVIIYPGVGHVPMEEIPSRTAQDALAFLNPSTGGIPRSMPR